MKNSITILIMALFLAFPCSFYASDRSEFDLLASEQAFGIHGARSEPSFQKRAKLSAEEKKRRSLIAASGFRYSDLNNKKPSKLNRIGVKARSKMAVFPSLRDRLESDKQKAPVRDIHLKFLSITSKALNIG